MSRRLDDGTVIIEVEPPRKCASCGRVAETRPYGEGGKEICFPCAEVEIQRHPGAVEARMKAHLFGGQS